MAPRLCIGALWVLVVASTAQRQQGPVRRPSVMKSSEDIRQSSNVDYVRDTKTLSRRTSENNNSSRSLNSSQPGSLFQALLAKHRSDKLVADGVSDTARNGSTVRRLDDGATSSAEGGGGGDNVESPPDFIIGEEEKFAYLAPIAVTLEAPPEREVRYTMDGSPPTRSSPFIMGGSSLHINRTMCLRAFVQSPTKYSFMDSSEVSATYFIMSKGENGRLGVGYLVPFYNAKPDYSGKLVSVDLVTEDYNQLRIAGIRTDFGDYYSSFTIEHGEMFGPQVYKAGTGAYMGEDMPKPQLVIRDYSNLPKNASAPPKETGLKGFQGGFRATFRRRTSSTSTESPIRYGSRVLYDSCEMTDLAGDSGPTQSSLLSWLSADFQDPTLLVDDTTPTPTQRPTVAPGEPTASPTASPVPSFSVAPTQYKYVAEPSLLQTLCYYERSRLDYLKVERNETTTVETDYGFLVPFFNGKGYFGTIVRLTLSETTRTFVEKVSWANVTHCCIPRPKYYNEEHPGEPLREFCCMNGTAETSSTTHDYTTSDRYRNETYEFTSHDTLDLAALDADLAGFAGGFTMGDYAYFVPFFDGKKYGHKVARVHIHEFSLNSTQVIDLRELSSDLAGFYGGFTYTNIAGKNYGFLVPHRAAIGPVGGLNSRLTADGFTGEEVFSGRSAIGGDHLTTSYHGKLVRIDLDNFDYENMGMSISDVVQVLDLSALDPDLRGFGGGFAAGKYGYLVPYKNAQGSDGHFGKAVRINLETFKVVGILDMTQNDPLAMGFLGGFRWGNYGLMVPHRNDQRDSSRLKLNHHGRVVRFDLNLFREDTIETLDLTNVSRMQVPDIPEPMLRGYIGGFAAGNYTYYVPFFNKGFQGKITRVDMRDFTLHVDAQSNGRSTSLQSPDFWSEYDGTQYIDLETWDDSLVGFSGGFVGPSSGSPNRPFEFVNVRTANQAQQQLTSKVPTTDTFQSESSSQTIHGVSRRLAETCRLMDISALDQQVYYDMCEDIYDRSRQIFQGLQLVRGALQQIVNASAWGGY